jgi:hypothetical protein
MQSVIAAPRARAALLNFRGDGAARRDPALFPVDTEIIVADVA